MLELWTPNKGVRNFHLAALLMLSACQQSWVYNQPEGLTQANGATLLGSKDTDPNPGAFDTRAYANAIDGKLTHGGWTDSSSWTNSSASWEKPHLASPGYHQIDIEVCKCNVLSDDNGGNNTVSAYLEAGKTYTVRATPPVQLTYNQSQSMAWIADDAGVPVSNKVAIILHQYTGGDMIAVPAGAGQTPLFVPMK